MTVKIKRKTKNLEKLFTKLKNLNNQNVESGYFKEQGDHPYAEMSYVRLMFTHYKGDGVIPRDVPTPTIFHFLSPDNKKDRIKDLNDYLYKDKPLQPLLDSIGYKVSNIAVEQFGVPSPHIPPNNAEWASYKGGNTPLVFEGHLRDAWSWRTSLNLSIQQP